MKRKSLIILILLACFGSALLARDCGDGLPCGPIPWDQISLPKLPTPTPIPIVDESGDIGDPTPAPTSAPGGIGEAPDVSGLAGPIATLNAVINATPDGISNLDNSYNNPDMQATKQAELGQNATNFFGYIKGLNDVNFGVLTPFLVFFLFSWTLNFIVKGSIFMLPIFTVIFGFIRKIVNLILEFLPL